MSWIEQRAQKELLRVREAQNLQVYPYFKAFETGGLHTSVGGRPIINFSSNDYLGLTHHPKVKEAAKAAVDRFACGLGSSRAQATIQPHVELEERLAEWFGAEAALIFTTGYQAMVGTIMSLADRDTTIILDNLSHACILDGTFLAAGTPRQSPEVRFFNHNSTRSLERCLKTKERENALVLIEGIYSLDGDLANLEPIIEVCERYGAVLVCDDAHGTGTLGVHGRGVGEHFLVEDKIPITVTTFSKSFGGIGGVLFGSRDVVEHIKHYARSFLFSASLPAPIVAAASTILDMLKADGPSLVRELQAASEYMRRGLAQVGFNLGISNTHIMPVMCRDERKALFMHVALYESGILMVPLTYPAVKEGEERLRINVTRGHTNEDMDVAIESLEKYGKAFYVLE